MPVCACVRLCVHKHHLPLATELEIPDRHSSPFQKQLISLPTSWLAATSKTKSSLEGHVLHTQTRYLRLLVQHHQSGWSRMTAATTALH